MAGKQFGHQTSLAAPVSPACTSDVYLSNLLGDIGTGKLYVLIDDFNIAIMTVT